MGTALFLSNSQSQTLSMNAQIIQSIKLLQFNQTELEAFVREQSDCNPLIEVVEPSEPRPATRNEEVLPKEGASERPAGPSMGQSGRIRSSPIDDFARDTQAASVSMREHLRRQLGMSIRDPAMARVAEEVVEALDDDGYFRMDPGVIADRLDVADETVEHALALVQQLEPTGVGARDLRECLSLQLAERKALDMTMEALLDHLPLIAKHDFRRLASLCRTDVEQIAAKVETIRSLDPRPGRGFDEEPIIPALPDVTVKRDRDGTFVTALVPDAMPRVLVNRRYYSEVRAVCARGSEARFVADCLKGASWLARNLDRRARTILSVATAIVAHQRDFLVHGREFLKPLNLRDVAEEIGVHQSTVSRAVANKYMMTDRGMFEFKFFFANAVAAADDGEGPSADTVRHKIRRLVAAETAETILSDDAIVQLLRTDGVEIARRTVAKYRETLRIPSSLQRRRQRELERSAHALATSLLPEPLLLAA